MVRSLPELEGNEREDDDEDESDDPADRKPALVGRAARFGVDDLTRHKDSF
jgi:hypothetical protein